MNNVGAFVSPKSNDILMDVIRAADPARERLAIERLQGKRESEAFETILTGALPKSLNMASNVGSNPPHKLPIGRSVGASFEAAMLSSLVENMFSSKSDSAFGSGVAGASFKNLFATQVAEQIVRSGGLGIAETIERHKNLRPAT